VQRRPRAGCVLVERVGLKREEGFSLIEMLVVVLILATLAAIAIPVYLSQREKGWDAATKASLKNTATAMEGYAVEFGGSYNGVTLDLLKTKEGLRLSPDINIEIAKADPTGYCIDGENLRAPTATQYFYDSSNGVPQPGNCP
jgi:type IV pilus assembly protein PilA